MIRRISTKLLLAVLAAVVVPFIGFGIFVDNQMADRLSREVVRSSLLGLAAELSSSIDGKIELYNRDIELEASDRRCNWAIDETREEPQFHAFRSTLTHGFDQEIAINGRFELLLLVDSRGKLVCSSTVAGPIGERLEGRDYTTEAWFQAAMAGRTSQLDQHLSDLLPVASEELPVPSRYHIGFAAPVFSELDPHQTEGAVFGLVNWSLIQEEIAQTRIRDYFQGLVGPEAQPPSSAYGWVWGSDADTILAHPVTSLYGQSISRDLGLPQMTASSLASDSGLYPEYEFDGKRKNAAFKHTRGPEQGGFDWVVGVGINNEHIFKGVHELRGQLVRATLLVLLVSILCTMMIARRTTAPILALQEHTRKVASGDLDTPIQVQSHDELGELAAAFNSMTAELKANREQLVKAEKDAAWREMARQVAHDIKNPLTPIKLSVDLLKRARDENSPDFERILQRTIDTVSRQVHNLRDIASDFNALTGSATAKPVVFDAGDLVDEVLELNAAWAEERGVKISRAGTGGKVEVDPGLLRRVLINLVSNAFEAMSAGGELRVDVGPRARPGGDRLVISITDSGPGIPEEVRARLFEPYFTTRTTGTGLGLAIAKRVIEEMGGEIALEPSQPAPGTTARITLPLYRGPS